MVQVMATLVSNPGIYHHFLLTSQNDIKRVDDIVAFINQGVRFGHALNARDARHRQCC